MEKDYKVKLDVFEGPLDLLLYLIKKDEIDIYDVSIERITSQYLSFLDGFNALNVEVASEFIVMAANLIYIKSRELLPKNQRAADDDSEEDDPRWELIRQLVEYKKFKDAALELGSREGKANEFYPANPELPDLTAAAPTMGQVGVFDLIKAFQRVLKRFEKGDDNQVREIVADQFTVGGKIDELLESIPLGARLKFEELFAEAATKIEVIVTFLAVLELMKLHHLMVEQEEMLGNIIVIRPENPELMHAPRAAGSEDGEAEPEASPDADYN
jgi:segregation and condensation protein A